MIKRPLPFVDPVIDDAELNKVIDVIKSKWLVEGKVVHELEDKFKDFVGTKYALAVTNGTTALHLAMEGIGINPGDEVITTPFTFIASVNSISFVGGIPKFVDIDPKTWEIDPKEIKKAITPKTKAILPVHIFGLPSNMPEIMEIAEENDLLVIEDAAQAHGAKINGKHVGGFGHVAAFSFYATKNMIAGEGGMVVTNDEELRDKMESIKNHGRPKKGGYLHLRIGYNFRMTDLCAAVGLAQLEKLPTLLNKRAKNAERLRKIIDQIEEIEYQFVPKGYTHANYVFAIKLSSSEKVDQLITYLKDNNIRSRRIYSTLAYKQPAYQNIKEWRWAKVLEYPDYSKVKTPIAKDIATTHMEIPVVPTLTQEELKYLEKVLLNWNG